MRGSVYISWYPVWIFYLNTCNLTISNINVLNPNNNGRPSPRFYINIFNSLFLVTTSSMLMPNTPSPPFIQVSLCAGYWSYYTTKPWAGAWAFPVSHNVLFNLFLTALFSTKKQNKFRICIYNIYYFLNQIFYLATFKLSNVINIAYGNFFNQ